MVSKTHSRWKNSLVLLYVFVSLVGMGYGETREPIMSGTTLAKFVDQDVALRGRPISEPSGAGLRLKDETVVLLDGIPRWPDVTQQYSVLVVRGHLRQKLIQAHPDLQNLEKRKLRWVADSPAVYLPDSETPLSFATLQQSSPTIPAPPTK